MIRIPGITLLLMLFGSPALCAEYGHVSDRDTERRQSPWHDIDADMSPAEYRAAYRQNRRQLLDFLSYHSKRALTTTGISERAIVFVGTAALLPVRDTRFNLNKSNTMAVQVQDDADEDRALLLEFKKKW